MSEYEHEFGRPLPAGFIEVPICLKCETEGRRCACQHNGLGRADGLRIKHADGKRLNQREREQMYRKPLVRAGRVQVVKQRGGGYNPIALGVVAAAHAGDTVFHGTRAGDEVSVVEQAQRKRAMRAAKRLKAAL